MTQKRRGIFSGKISDALLNHGFNTDDEQLKELTVLSSREVFIIAGVDAINRGREDAAKLMGYVEYRSDLRKYEKLMAQWRENPVGAEPVRPKPVVMPKMVFLSDIFNLKYMRYKRSQDGLALKELYKMGSTALEVSVEEADEGPAYDAP